MQIAVMQPTYLPWLGYFDLMARAEVFVFLDDASFSRQSWQQRNRVIAGDRMTWLTVPVQTSGHAGQRIDQVKVRDELPWRRKHMRTISESLARAPWRALVDELVSREMSGSRTDLLCEINIGLIKAVADCLGLKPEILRSSEMAIGGTRSDRLVAICRRLGADRYLSPRGAATYIAEDGSFDRAGIEVEFQSISPPPYRDVAPLNAGEFPTVLDALAWIGPEATRSLLQQEAQ